jgi:hypothetical protein
MTPSGAETNTDKPKFIAGETPDIKTVTEFLENV